MPDRHARRDTNQSAFDKEYFDLIEETAIRIKQLDDTVDVTQFDRIIYDEIEWWKVPNWDDRLYYQAYEQWIYDTPAAQAHAAQKAGTYNTTVFPRQLTKMRGSTRTNQSTLSLMDLMERFSQMAPG